MGPAFGKGGPTIGGTWNFPRCVETTLEFWNSHSPRVTPKTPRILFFEISILGRFWENSHGVCVNKGNFLCFKTLFPSWCIFMQSKYVYLYIYILIIYVYIFLTRGCWYVSIPIYILYVYVYISLYYIYVYIHIYIFNLHTIDICFIYTYIHIHPFPAPS